MRTPRTWVVVVIWMAVTLASSLARGEERVLIQIRPPHDDAVGLFVRVMERDECKSVDLVFDDGLTHRSLLYTYNSMAAMVYIENGRSLWWNLTSNVSNIAKDMCNCVVHGNCSDVKSVENREGR